MNTKQEVMENLQMVDEYMPAMFPELKKLSFVVTGGASFLLKGYTNKVTLDIDSITEMDESVLSFLESFSINNAASEVTPLSSSYTERLTKIRGGFGVLDVSVLGNEDLVASKIGRLSEDDLRDIEDTGIMEDVDFSLLTAICEEISEKIPGYGHKWNYFKNYFQLNEVA
ncbi:hypothetical protein JMA_42710 (plasmid) [Jeotgalibacillus malaysiensis]|uniref:DUF6036 domain-containing protein n=1 Tax=Jeotgalibacillus malaysiensis TaxID=1508404 RepID=A0A0B5AYJ5_9BACL|nr:DUF6036 family nucleotidyltransferase [Jeotgalibacillus malaysiensis]AJD93588.1 hypothetical protein JMA_42710 [Jeotgalibacillus malaysiensis]